MKRHLFLALGIAANSLLGSAISSSAVVAQDKPKPTAAAAVDPEQQRYDKIVDDFIAYDVGQLRGQAGVKAYQAFEGMTGDGTIPALVRGVNRAASIRNSCPIVVLSSKLQSMLQSCTNGEMLEYAFQNLKVDPASQHYASYVQSLKQLADECYANLTETERRLNQRVLKGGGTASQLRRTAKPTRDWKYEDLVEALGQEKDAELVQVLDELKKRPGAEYTSALTDAIAIVPEDVKPIARGLLAQRFVRMTDATLKSKLTNPNPEVRAAAARAIGYKEAPLLPELAVAVRDRERAVAEFARESLVKLTGADEGPAEGTQSPLEWYAASKRWEKRVSQNAQNAPAAEKTAKP